MNYIISYYILLVLISGFLYLTESVISTFGSHLVVYMGIDTIS